MRKQFFLLLIFVGMWVVAWPYNNTYAVIVGVADYKNDDCAEDRPYNYNNAMAVYNFLTSKKGGSVPAANICLLLDSQATKNNIIYQAKAIFAKAKKNDRVVFYFGGHGGEGCFTPYDFNGFYESTLTYGDVKSIFQSAKCNTKLLFADACYSGGIKEKAQKTLAKSKKEPQTTTDKMNIAVMVASKADEYSWCSSDIQMSVFTYYLIEGLGGAANTDGNKYVTIQELYYYVYHKVLEKTKYYEMQQTPQLFGKFDLRLIVANV